VSESRSRDLSAYTAYGQQTASRSGFRPTRYFHVYLTWANPLFLAFFSFNRINNLRGISGAHNSDSPRLQFNVFTIN